MNELIELYKISADNPSKKEHVQDVVCMLARKVKHTCPEGYNEALAKMYEIAYDGHFSESLARRAVASMKNADGTTGEHWNMPQVREIIKNYGIAINEYDFYYVINMLYSDFCKILGSDMAVYINLTKAYINDVDAPKDKALKLYLATHNV